MPGIPHVSGPTSLPQYDATRGQNGMWAVPNIGYLFTTFTPAASTYRCMRFVPTRPMTIVKIGFVTTLAATNNDNVDVGLFDATGARLVSSGATAGKANATAGAQTIAITSTSLSPGVAYYAGLAYGTIGGTAATMLAVTPQALGATAMFGSTAGKLEVSATNTGATLPDPMVFGVTSSQCFALAVLES